MQVQSEKVYFFLNLKFQMPKDFDPYQDMDYVGHGQWKAKRTYKEAITDAANGNIFIKIKFTICKLD